MPSSVVAGLPVSASSQPPASSTSTSTAVFGSTCRHIPSRRPSSGRSAAYSSRSAASSGMFARVHAIRSAPSVIGAIKDEGLPRAREPFHPVTSWDFVEALPADYRRRVNASPPRWLGDSPSGSGDTPLRAGTSTARTGNLQRRTTSFPRLKKTLADQVDGRSSSTAARTKQLARWSLTTPQACMAAYAVVGPTNRKPAGGAPSRARPTRASSRPSRRSTAAPGGAGGRCDQNSSSSGVPASRRATVARAFAIVASILPR